MKRATLITAACAALLLVAAVALGQGMEKKAAMTAKATKPSVSTYLIVSPHEADECLAVMDEVNRQKELAGWDWGCMAGNHTAYRIVRAVDENAALATVPENVRSKAQVYKIMKMTPSMLEKAHKEHM